MRIRHTLAIAVLAAGIGGLIVPVLAQSPDGKAGMPDQPTGTTHMDHGPTGGGMMGGGMMGGGMMGGGMMGGGMMQSMNGMMQSMNGMMQSMNAMMQSMSGMMQSMNSGDGRPNSQWQAHPSAKAPAN